MTTYPLALSRCLLPTVLVAAMLACGGGSEPLPVTATLDAMSSTDGQSAPAGARLPNALAVVAHDAGGVNVPRAAVRWTVTAGSGGTLSDSVTVADGGGRAEVVFTLGPTPGEYRVQAEAVASPGVTATLTATATAPPQLTSVTPANFTGGDTLVLGGTALAATAEVYVAGALARVLGGSSTSITVTAPYCLAPGFVSIRARVAGATSNDIQGTYASSAAPIALDAGEYGSFDPAQLAGCATFPDAGASAVEYLLAPQSVVGLPGVSAAYRLRGDSVVVVLQASEAAGTPLPFAVRFHDALRAQEAKAAALPRPPLANLRTSPLSSPTVKVGDKRAFRVCNTLPCSVESQFGRVTAEAQYVGVHAAVFVDQAVPAGGLTPADIEVLGTMFDDVLYDVDTDAFGSESDIDANGVVIILFSPEVNKLTPKDQCGTSVITGFFYGVDIDPAFVGQPFSNRGEIFYALAPDPNETVSCKLSTATVRRLVPVTFIHEFQHMISYNQHVLVRNGDSEVLWLNEGMSHIAEELGGLYYEAQGNDSLFSAFAIGDLYDASLFLTDPGATFALPSQGTGELEERGAAWLFLRWLVDQYGPETTRRLVETSKLGAENVEAAVGVPVRQLLSQWFLANWVSDLPSFSPPAPLQYSAWHFRKTFASLHDQLPSRFPTPFPLEPRLFQGGTFQFDGTLRAGSGDYFRIVQDPGQRGFTVLLTDPGGGPVSAGVVPRLNVIRIR